MCICGQVQYWTMGEANIEKTLRLSCFYSLSYDESLNKPLQKQQMDLQVRYWCDQRNQAVTRYYGSEFMLLSDHAILTESLLKGISDIPEEKLVQLAMDGPHVNWKTLGVLQERREENEFPPLADIGSCSLHVVSGALHSAVVAADWPVEKVLRGMYKFLQDAPARRAEYLRVSITGLYPQKFCVIRWVENEPVADRAIVIWKDIVELIKVIQAKVPSKRPKDNTSYENLVVYHANSLIPVYLHLFRDVAVRLNVFLVKFQTDSPMVPFLSKEVAAILRWAMRFFIQKAVLVKADTPFKLCKLDIHNEDNMSLKTNIKLTTSAIECLKEVPPGLHHGLKKSWVAFLTALIDKIQERSPLKYKLVRVAAVLDPLNMAFLDAEVLQRMFDSLVGIMFSNKHISAKKADLAKEQFGEFLVNVVAPNKNAFLEYCMKSTRLDDFLAFYVCCSTHYNDFWFVCKFVFTLTHGQSSVERGFNVNKKTAVENLEELGLTSLRMIYDAIMYHGGKVKDFPIPNSLLIACQSASAAYKDARKQQEEEQAESQTATKGKLIMEELCILKKRKADEENVIKQLRDDSDKLVLQAGATADVDEMRSLVAKASSFKKTVNEKERGLPGLISSIEKIEDEMKLLK